MIANAKQWIFKNPHLAASLVFLGVALFGLGLLGWGQWQLGFLLLLYFILSLGIRLDEISRTLGGGRGCALPDAAEEETVLAQLREIRALLAEIKAAQQQPAERAPEEGKPSADV